MQTLPNSCNLYQTQATSHQEDFKLLQKKNIELGNRVGVRRKPAPVSPGDAGNGTMEEPGEPGKKVKDLESKIWSMERNFESERAKWKDARQKEKNRVEEHLRDNEKEILKLKVAMKEREDEISEEDYEYIADLKENLKSAEAETSEARNQVEHFRKQVIDLKKSIAEMRRNKEEQKILNPTTPKDQKSKEGTASAVEEVKGSTVNEEGKDKEGTSKRKLSEDGGRNAKKKDDTFSDGDDSLLLKFANLADQVEESGINETNMDTGESNGDVEGVENVDAGSKDPNSEAHNIGAVGGNRDGLASGKRDGLENENGPEVANVEEMDQERNHAEIPAEVPPSDVNTVEANGVNRMSDERNDDSDGLNDCETNIPIHGLFSSPDPFEHSAESSPQ